jgi:hypothetical protein
MAIWHGADNGSQMGVYRQIQETEAVRNVQLRAPEYLPVSLESGIFLHPSRPILELRPAPVAYGLPPARCHGSGADDEQDAFFFGIGVDLL